MCEACNNNCDCHLDKGFSRFMSTEQAFEIVMELAKRDICEDSDEILKLAIDVADDFLLNNVYN